MPIEHRNFKVPQGQRTHHGLPRNSPTQSSAQAHPASNSQSGSQENTSGSLLSSSSNTLINGGQFTAAANVNRNVTINIGATEDFIPQTQTENCRSRQAANRRRRRTQMQPQQDPTPTRGSRSNQIYERHLREKKRGHPLWIPQPNMVLPIPYRAQGGRIGDVGIFTDDGAFDFLFNICVPGDDPINPEELPINFVPIRPSINPIDIRKFAEFGPSSYLASSSITESRTAEQSSGLIFESSASEGAILAMPEGAYSENLSNVSRVQEYIATQAEDWYKFVNGPRGREAQNGDLRVVIGCDKTISWGMATFTNSSMSQGTNFRLKFSAFEGQPSSQRNAGDNYMWEHSSSGLVEMRVGPGRDENKELGETNSDRLRNQSLFLRTLNVTLSKHVWEEIFPQKVVVKDENTSHQDQSDLPSSRSSHSHSPENLPVRRHHSNDSHPSKIINQYLLEQNPLARVAVTHDRDWSGVIMDSSLPHPSQMISAILFMNDVVLNNDTGLVFLEPKETQQNGMSNEGKLTELIESIKNGRLTLDQYLFGFPGERCLLQDFCKALHSGLTNQPTSVLSSLMGHPERPLSLDELLNMCNGGFHVQGSTQRQSIVSLRAQLTLLSSQHADRSSCLLRLADALSRRYYQWTQRDDLEEAIWSYKEALSLLPSSHYRYLETLLGLCSSLYQRFYLLGHEDDLKDLLRSLELEYDMFNVRRSLLAPVEAQLETRHRHPYIEVVLAPDPDVLRGKAYQFGRSKPNQKPAPELDTRVSSSWLRTRNFDPTLTLTSTIRPFFGNPSRLTEVQRLSNIISFDGHDGQELSEIDGTTMNDSESQLDSNDCDSENSWYFDDYDTLEQPPSYPEEEYPQSSSIPAKMDHSSVPTLVTLFPQLSVSDHSSGTPKAHKHDLHNQYSSYDLSKSPRRISLRTSQTTPTDLYPRQPTCVICRVQLCYDDRYVTCGIKCEETLCKRGNSNPKICDYCHRRPKISGHNQCGQTCRDNARTACLLCRCRPKFGRYPLCGRMCKKIATKWTPLILEARLGHTIYDEVEQRFKRAWKGGGVCPSIKKIYKIIENKSFLLPYDRYKKQYGNEVFRYHGTSRRCTLGSDGNTQLCSSTACALCSILRTSFKVSLANPGGCFGAGVYSSSAANKAYGYMRGSGALILTKVVLGNAYNASTGWVRSCPSGYNSVVYDQNGATNETIIYTDDAIRPVYLIIF